MSILEIILVVIAFGLAIVGVILEPKRPTPWAVLILVALVAFPVILEGLK